MSERSPSDSMDSLGEAVVGLRSKYDALSSAFAKQEKTMKDVAKMLRDGPMTLTSWDDWVNSLADELDPPEPQAEADAAEAFAQDCAKRGQK